VSVTERLWPSLVKISWQPHPLEGKKNKVEKNMSTEEAFFFLLPEKKAIKFILQVGNACAV
jgi:hypothetical protein